MSQITVYLTDGFPACQQVIELLDEHEVTYETRDVNADAEAWSEMVRHSGQHGVPVTAIDQHVIVGFDPTAIEQALAEARA